MSAAPQTTPRIAHEPAPLATPARARSRRPASPVRRARVRDLDALAAFIAEYTQDGTLLPRTRADLRAHLGQFRLLWEGDQLVGCGALQTVSPHLAEVRSLAVHPAKRGAGLGSELVRALLADAARRGIPRVFCLTRRVGFFGRLGFVEVPKESFPHKIWNDCRHCPLQEHCDEVAMERHVPAAVSLEDTWSSNAAARPGRSIGRSIPRSRT